MYLLWHTDAPSHPDHAWSPLRAWVSSSRVRSVSHPLVEHQIYYVNFTITRLEPRVHAQGTEGDEKPPVFPPSLSSEAEKQASTSTKTQLPARLWPTTGPMLTFKEVMYHSEVGACNSGHVSGPEKEDQVRTHIKIPPVSFLFFLGTAGQSRLLYFLSHYPHTWARAISPSCSQAPSLPIKTCC